MQTLLVLDEALLADGLAYHYAGARYSAGADAPRLSSLEARARAFCLGIWEDERDRAQDRPWTVEARERAQGRRSPSPRSRYAGVRFNSKNFARPALHEE